MKIFVKAKPGAKVASVLRLDEGLFGVRGEVRFVVAVKEPPADGRANRAIERAVAEHLQIPASQVRVIAGHASRNKILEILETT